MTKTAADEAVDRYLARLDHALEGIPAERRDELVGEIIEHVVQGRWELPDRDDEAAVLTLLERLGAPEEIAAAERESGAGRAASTPPPSVATPGTDGREKLAIILLLFGGFVAGIGWLAGVVLLWLSPRWRDRDKLIGTLLIPGGMATAFLALTFFAGQVVVSDDGGCAAAATAATLIGCPEEPSSSPLPALLLIAAALLVPVCSAGYLLHRLKVTRPAR